jgi:hypothetical protein
VKQDRPLDRGWTPGACRCRRHLALFCHHGDDWGGGRCRGSAVSTGKFVLFKESGPCDLVVLLASCRNGCSWTAICHLFLKLVSMHVHTRLLNIWYFIWI